MSEQAATYRDVFRVREYRYLFSANVLSMVGDQLAAIALAFLVLSISGSPALAALSFASSYAAWIVGGPMLSVLADRLPRRTVLIACDIVRGTLFLLLTTDFLPAGALVAIAFAAHLFHAPFLAARAALVPEILDGDRYTVANGLDNLFQSVTQIAGFALGGLLLTVLTSREALLLDALTFAASALLIAVGVRRRAAASTGPKQRSSQVTAGIRVVFGDRTLRAYVLLLWAGCAFVFAPEGLLLSLAGQYGGDARIGGLLLAAAPLGGAAGAVILTRFIGPDRRSSLIRPFALGSCAALVPVLFAPPLWIVLVLLAVAGFGNAYCVPLNPLFGRAVPNEYRARAFGVAMGGLCAFQGLAMAGAGALAELISPATVTGLCGIAGTVAIGALALRWPRTQPSSSRIRPAAGAREAQPALGA
jgi:predicted MFS family arabinose efflux permease